MVGTAQLPVTVWLKRRVSAIHIAKGPVALRPKAWWSGARRGRSPREGPWTNGPRPRRRGRHRDRKGENSPHSPHRVGVRTDRRRRAGQHNAWRCTTAGISDSLPHSGVGNSRQPIRCRRCPVGGTYDRCTGANGWRSPNFRIPLIFPLLENEFGCIPAERTMRCIIFKLAT